MTTFEKHEKMHTIELTENELARVLFVMSMVNGEVYGNNVTSLALEKLNMRPAGASALFSKRRELAKIANLPELIDYFSIQQEWETFLGISEDKNKEILQ